MAIFNCKIPISHICENERLERVETLQSSAEKTINVISPGQLFADRERRPGLFADQNGKAGGVAFSQLFPNSFRFCVAVFDSRHLTMSCCTERMPRKHGEEILENSLAKTGNRHGTRIRTVMMSLPFTCTYVSQGKSASLNFCQKLLRTILQFRVIFSTFPISILTVTSLFFFRFLLGWPD